MSTNKDLPPEESTVVTPDEVVGIAQNLTAWLVETLLGRGMDKWEMGGMFIGLGLRLFREAAPHITRIDILQGVNSLIDQQAGRQPIVVRPFIPYKDSTDKGMILAGVRNLRAAGVTREEWVKMVHDFYDTSLDN